MSHFKNYGSNDSITRDMTSNFGSYVQSVAANIHKITQNVSLMQRWSLQLGTAQDSDTLRTQLYQLQHDTNTLARATNGALKDVTQLVQGNQLRRIQRDKLTSDFSDALASFQEIQRLIAKRVKENPVRQRPVSVVEVSGEEQKQQGQQTSMQIEDEANLAELQERELALRNLEADIVEVNQIFTDLSKLVYDQGEAIESIERNVDSAVGYVRQGRDEVATARVYQQRARRKQMCLILILVVVLCVVALIIYLST